MTITLPKLLLLLAIAWLVWVFLRKSKIIGREKAEAAPQNPRATQRSERTIEDMVKCPKCDAYVPEKGGHNCTGA